MQIISGKFKKRKLFSPKGNQTRPSSNRLRETLFNICAPFIEDAVFFDLFAGSGAIGFEALSRGAKKVVFIDEHKFAIESIKKNIALLKAEEDVTVFQGDVFLHLSKIKTLCDIIFADPPYDMNKHHDYISKLLNHFDHHTLLNPEGHLFIECSKSQKMIEKTFETLELIDQRVIGDSKLIHYRFKN
jgi:16S rRNA (guanine966-N2)-methyltransferase